MTSDGTLLDDAMMPAIIMQTQGNSIGRFILIVVGGGVDDELSRMNYSVFLLRSSVVNLVCKTTTQITSLQEGLQYFAYHKESTMISLKTAFL